MSEQINSRGYEQKDWAVFCSSMTSCVQWNLMLAKNVQSKIWRAQKWHSEMRWLQSFADAAAATGISKRLQTNHKHIIKKWTTTRLQVWCLLATLFALAHDNHSQLRREFAKTAKQVGLKATPRNRKKRRERTNSLMPGPRLSHSSLIKSVRSLLKGSTQ